MLREGSKEIDGVGESDLVPNRSAHSSTDDSFLDPRIEVF